VGVENLKVRDHMKEVGLDDRVHNITTNHEGNEGLDLIRVTQDREYWRAFVKTVINIRVP
jgi:hypothetical protein